MYPPPRRVQKEPLKMNAERTTVLSYETASVRRSFLLYGRDATWPREATWIFLLPLNRAVQCSVSRANLSGTNYAAN